MHDDPVYRPQQAWEYLGVSRTTFFKLIREKRLPDPVRYSARAIGYRRSTLDTFIKNCEAA
jgi:predicted DNA-binding transcriptional regulator AlpA